MSESYTLPTKPEGMVATLRERFNSGKVSAMMGMYAPDAVLIAKDGRTITDHTEIAAELERDLKLGLPLEAKARHVFVAGDIAQIVLDWSIDGTGRDGKHVHLGGSASDILRRGAEVHEMSGVGPTLQTSALHKAGRVAGALRTCRSCYRHSCW